MRAIDAAERAFVVFQKEYGDDVAVMDASKGKKACLLGWNFESSGGAFELWAQYAAADPRPVEIALNGSQVIRNALVDSTYGWTEAFQFWFFQGQVQLQIGSNHLSLSGPAMPHVRAIRLIPVSARRLPDVSVRSAWFKSSIRRLEDETLLDFIRSVTPTIRQLLASGATRNEVVEVFSGMVQAAAADLESPQKRIGFLGPFNGQVIRQKLFTEMDRLFRFDVFVETGAYLGTTTEMLANYCRPVFSCELRQDFYYRAAMRLAHMQNVFLFRKDSRDFLRYFCAKYASGYSQPFFYLDAHWNEDLPLPDEISIISDNFTDYVIMVDDFKHPSFNYLFDSYKRSGIELSLEYLTPKLTTTEGLSFLFPMHSERVESGSKRGTLIIAPNHIAARLLDSGILLMPHPA